MRKGGARERMTAPEGGGERDGKGGERMGQDEQKERAGGREREGAQEGGLCPDARTLAPFPSARP
jgi:hypothetical protein